MLLHMNRFLTNLDRLEQENPNALAEITKGAWSTERSVAVKHALSSCAAFYFSPPELYTEWTEMVQQIYDMWEKDTSDAA